MVLAHESDLLSGPPESPGPRGQRVLFYPAWHATDYYFLNLRDELAALGWEVVFAPYSGLLMPLSRNATRAQAPLLHVHFEYPITGAFIRPAWKSWALLAQFLLDLMFLRLAGRKVVYTVHNLWTHDRTNATIDRLSRRVLARQAEAVIVHGPSGVPLVRDAYRVPVERVHVVPHGHYRANYPITVARDSARARWGLEDRHWAFLFFGSVRPYKGLEDLLDAFAELPSPDLRLIVAGRPASPEYLSRLQARTADPRVVWCPGFVAPDGVQWFMQASDAVVFPFAEVFTSGSLVTALSFRKRVVAPDKGLVRDYLPAGAGVLYETPAVPTLAEALREVMLTDEEAAGAAIDGLLPALDWHSIARRTAAVYELALGRDGAL